MGRDEVIKLITEWVQELPPGTASFTIEEIDVGTLVRIRPTREGACDVGLVLGWKDFDGGCGHVMFTAEPFDAELFVDLLEAAKAGKVRDALGPFYRVSELWLPGQETPVRSFDSLLSMLMAVICKLLGLKNSRFRTYQPWC
jgi:hypothetical protein